MGGNGGPGGGGSGGYTSNSSRHGGAGGSGGGGGGGGYNANGGNGGHGGGGGGNGNYYGGTEATCNGAPGYVATNGDEGGTNDAQLDSTLITPSGGDHRHRPQGPVSSDLKWIKAATSVEAGMVKQADGSFAFPEPAAENAIAATLTGDTADQARPHEPLHDGGVGGHLHGGQDRSHGRGVPGQAQTGRTRRCHRSRPRRVCRRSPPAGFDARSESRRSCSDGRLGSCPPTPFVDARPAMCQVAAVIASLWMLIAARRQSPRLDDCGP